MNKIIKYVIIPLLFLTSCGGNEQPTAVEKYIATSENTIFVMEDFTYQLEVEILKPGTLVFFSATDDNIATVSDEGLVTGVKEGSTTVHIRGGKDSLVVTVNVLPYQAPETLQIVSEQDSFILQKGDTFELPFVAKFGNTVIENAIYTYDIENEDVVSIDNLSVTAKDVGSTKCIAKTSYNEIEATFLFTINVY